MREQARVVLAVARDATLARIELAYFGFNMAEYATWMAVLVWAYGLGGAGTAALFALVQLIPSGLVAPFAAAASDRFPRGRVLLAGYILQALGLGATAVSLYAGAPVAVTLAVATMASASFTITRPIQGVILPGITHSPADLTAANAVSGLAENVGIFVGPLIGGLLLVRSEPGDVFAAFAVTSAVGAMLVARLPASVDAGRAPTAGGVRTIMADTFGGFAVLWSRRDTLVVVTILVATTIVIGGLDILFVATAIDLLGIGESWAGFLYSAFGLGGVLGAVTTVSLVGRRRLTPAVAGTGGLFGLSISAVSIVPTPITAPVLLAASGAGYSVLTVAGRTLLQRVAPEAVLARVFGVLEGLTMFALAVGSVASGLLISALGVGGALVATGLFVPAVIGLAWVRLGAIDRHARPIDREALRLLRGLSIFAPLSAPTIERILAELVWLDIPEGHVLIRQGDPADRFYVMAEGHVEVLQDGVKIAERHAVDHFGEIALLRDVPRTATVRALTPLRVFAIERERFLEAVTGHAQSRAHAEAVAAERS